jgi:hypothetical protein
VAENRLKTAAARLSQRMRGRAASPVTYRRGEVRLDGLAATKGLSTFELSDASGALTRVDSVDFIVTAADLVLSGVVTLPRRGDTVTDEDGVVHTVYPVNGTDCWRWSDTQGYTSLRVHTKVTEDEAHAE